MTDSGNNEGAQAGAVLYVSGDAELYGSDRVLNQTVAEVAARGWRPTVVLAEDGPLVPILGASGARVATLRLGVIRRRLLSPAGALRIAGGLATSIPRLRRMAREDGVEIVHTNTSNVLSGAVVARLCSLPHVWHVREHLGSVRGGPVLTRILDLCADSVVTVSKAVGEDLRVLRPELASRISVIRDGIDLERFRKLPPRDDSILRLGLEPQRPVVACVARINSWKGQDVLVEAAAEMSRRSRPQIVITGGVYPGDEAILARLHGLISRTGLKQDTVFTGFLEDPRLVYAAADVVVAPSTRPEPQGQTVMEALSAGVPVIASAEGGHLESIRHDVDGILVRPRDTRSLTEALMRILRNDELRIKMSRAAFADRGRFSTGPPAEALIGVYESLRRGRSAGGALAFRIAAGRGRALKL